jgi:hypothetical protein
MPKPRLTSGQHQTAVLYQSRIPIGAIADIRGVPRTIVEGDIRTLRKIGVIPPPMAAQKRDYNEYKRPSVETETVPARRCLSCRTEFQPATRFLFRCTSCRSARE